MKPLVTGSRRGPQRTSSYRPVIRSRAGPSASCRGSGGSSATPWRRAWPRLRSSPRGRTGKTGVAAALALAHLAGPGFRQGWRAAVCSLSRDKAGELLSALTGTMRASASTRRSSSATPLTRARWPASTTYRPTGVRSRRAGRGRGAVRRQVRGPLGRIRLGHCGRDGADDRTSPAAAGGLRSSVSARGGLPGSPDHPGKRPIHRELIERGDKLKSTVVHLYEGRRGADLADRANWRASNPGLGPIKRSSYMRDRVREVTVTPENEAHFRAHDLNEQVELGGRATPARLAVDRGRD